MAPRGGSSASTAVGASSPWIVSSSAFSSVGPSIASIDAVAASGRSSSIAKQTTVMLSSPPTRLAAFTSPLAAARRSSGCSSKTVRMPPSSTIVGQPVRAEQVDVARLGRDGEGVHVDVRVGADRARDHGALRVRVGLLGRQPAAPHELGDERVVVGELLEVSVAEPVGTRVSDVADRHAAVVHDRHGHRRAHPRRGRVLVGACEHAAVGLLDQLDHLLLGRALGDAVVLERRGGQARGDLSGARAAHSVRDREQRRPLDVRVLVVPPLAPGVGGGRVGADPHTSYLRSVSPTRTTSPGARRRGSSTFSPLTNVPLVEPASSTHTPSR